MDQSFLLAGEVVIFFISCMYIGYYFGEKILVFVRKKISFQEIKKTPLGSKKTKKKTKKTSDYSHDYNKTLSDQQKKELKEIVKRVGMNISKGYLDTAKNLIVEGMALDNKNKHLHLELADIYEREKNYKHAEYLYRDLLEIVPGGAEVFKKLAHCLAIQAKLDDAIVYYKKAFEKDKGDFEVGDALANLFFESGKYDECLKYNKLCLVQKPRNVDVLTMKALCLEKISSLDEALLAYKKILEIQPYNSDVIKKVQELEAQ